MSSIRRTEKERLISLFFIFPYSVQSTIKYLMRNGLELRVFGPRRAGNHAVINWLARQAPHRIHFFNCASHRGLDPYRTGKSRGDKDNEELQACFESIPNLQDADEEMIESYRERDKEILMYSYEDLNFDKYVKPRPNNFPKDRRHIIGTSDFRVDVVIVRDVYNWLASKLKYDANKRDYKIKSILAERFKPNRELRKKMPYFDTYPGWRKDGRKLDGKVYINLNKMVYIWMSHIRALDAPIEYGLRNPVFVNYNQWATNYTYRENLIEEHFEAHGFKFTDAGKNEIAVRGGGSSFDGHGIGSNANEMDVLNRWRYFEGNKLYERIFEFYPHLDVVNNRIFGNIIKPKPTEESNILQFKG